MDKRHYTPVLFRIFCISIFLVSFFSCTAVPPKKPMEDTSVPRQYPDMEVYKKKSDDTKISLIKILSSEAEKFLWQGNFQDALFVYNQALAMADDREGEQLMAAIEKTLEKSPAKDIREFSEIQHIHIPKSLLMYWLGVNYGLEDEPSLSKNTLEEFILKYPEHPYAGDARELVSIIGKTFFDRTTIGCLLPLSGKYAIFGERALSAIQLAIEELGAKYSKEFKLIVKDTKADPLIAEQCVRQLHQKNVAGIIGPLLAIREAGVMAEQLGMPMIALTQKSDFPLRGEYLFANFITPQMQVDTLGAYLFGNLGVKKIAILYPDEKYGRTYMDLFWDIADEYGAKVVGVEAYDGKNTDFSVPIQKLTGEYFPLPDFLIPEEADVLMDEDGNIIEQDKEQSDDDTDLNPRNRNNKKEEKIEIDFEALFIPDSPSKVKLILPQLAFNDATGMYLVGTNLWHHESLLKDARGYNKQAVITDGFFGKSKNPITAEFNRTYENIFEEKPKFLEAIAYDTASMMLTTAMHERVDSRQSLRDALKAGIQFEGATGSTVFDQNGSARRDLFLITVKKGRFVEISR